MNPSLLLLKLRCQSHVRRDVKYAVDTRSWKHTPFNSCFQKRNINSLVSFSNCNEKCISWAYLPTYNLMSSSLISFTAVLLIRSILPKVTSMICLAMAICIWKYLGKTDLLKPVPWLGKIKYPYITLIAHIWSWFFKSLLYSHYTAPKCKPITVFRAPKKSVPMLE